MVCDVLLTWQPLDILPYGALLTQIDKNIYVSFRVQKKVYSRIQDSLKTASCLQYTTLHYYVIKLSAYRIIMCT
jgi:hypothetical protein